MITDLVIPELEAMLGTYTVHGVWTDDEIAGLKRYYGRVPIGRLATLIHHSVPSCDEKAAAIGLPPRSRR